MPYFLEVASFENDSVFGSMPSPLIDVVGRFNGCVSAFGGYALEDKRRAYIITAWTSYEAYCHSNQTRHVLSTLASHFTSNTFNPSSSPLLVHHLYVDVHPHRTLSAPVTEIVVFSARASDDNKIEHVAGTDPHTTITTRPVTGHSIAKATTTTIKTTHSESTQRAWQVRVNEGVERIKRGLCEVDGAYPPLLWGEISQIPGCYMMLVGWDGVEAHTNAVRQPSLRKYVAEVLKMSQARMVHTKLRSLVRVNPGLYSPACSERQRTGSDEDYHERKLHTLM